MYTFDALYALCNYVTMLYNGYRNVVHPVQRDPMLRTMLLNVLLSQGSAAALLGSFACLLAMLCFATVSHLDQVAQTQTYAKHCAFNLKWAAAAAGCLEERLGSDPAELAGLDASEAIAARDVRQTSAQKSWAEGAPPSLPPCASSHALASLAPWADSKWTSATACHLQTENQLV